MGGGLKWWHESPEFVTVLLICRKHKFAQQYENVVSGSHIPWKLCARLVLTPVVLSGTLVGERLHALGKLLGVHGCLDVCIDMHAWRQAVSCLDYS